MSERGGERGGERGRGRGMEKRKRERERECVIERGRERGGGQRWRRGRGRGERTHTVNSSSHSGVAVFFNVPVLRDASFCPSITTSQNGLVRDTERRRGEIGDL